MAALLKVLAAIPGVISGVKAILDIFTKYFPPKTERQRGVDQAHDRIKKVREVQLETNKKVKAAKLGKTKAIEDMFNRP